MSIFKAYDIRGIYPEQLNEEIVYKIGRAFADMLKEEVKKEIVNIVVARDMRISSPQLTEKLIEGVTKQGVNVVDIGLASTPTFYFAVGYLNLDGGMIVSASHNPKEYNGVKIVRAKAKPFGAGTGMEELERRVNQNIFKQADKLGQVTRETGVLGAEVKHALKHAAIDKLKLFKIVTDTANAMGGPYLEALFANFPCNVIKMNFDLDGTFPAHQADPFQEKNIIDIKKRVIEEKADLGIATDGDGDRIFFIDEKGKLAEPWVIRGLLARIILKQQPGSKICYDIRPGMITHDMIVENGGIPVVTRVGHSLIKAQAIQERAVFAGESSGHFFMKTDYGFFEVPMIVTLKILEELSLADKPFSEILRPLRKYFHSGEINSVVKDKAAVMKKIENTFSDGRINKLDGITIAYPDYWFNVRPSNTEPLLRLNLEAKTKDKMKEMKDKLLKIIRA
ncbi:phosphomannomutase/phosphoglucomutase [Candidatus Woesearchaeota archaeon]|nr:phosphomannomutase/phosphoglucomutase [Candidatus Woesearchaeota archaeon]